MGFLTKLLLYLFISTTTLVFSYELVQYARDSMRISNMNTFYKVILYYQGMESLTPPSGKKHNPSKFLFEKGYLENEFRDPAFTSSTVIMDEYAFILIKFYEKVTKYVDPEAVAGITSKFSENFDSIFSGTEKDQNEQLERIRSIMNNNNLLRNRKNLKEVIDISDKDMTKFRKMMRDPDLKKNIAELKKQATQPIPPDCLIAYVADVSKKEFEISVKLESKFMQGKMKSDGGNDDERLEVGNNLQLNTEVEVYGNKARAKNSKVSIIR
jgi:hypothetical protein